jgi:hypothetical protein
MEFRRDGKDRTFNSGLHSRREMLGAHWLVESCCLGIADTRATKVAYDYSIVRVSRSMLVLREKGAKLLIRYRCIG